MRKILIGLIAVPIVIGIFAALGGVKFLQIRSMIAAGKAFSIPPETVTSATATPATWQSALEAVGTVAAVQGITIRAELPGTVSKIAFESGDNAREGQVLVQLDVASEEAQLRAAEAQAELARLNLERSRGLREKSTISQSEFDSARANFEQTVGQADMMRASIDKKTIRAPFSGRLGIRTVNLGQFVTAGDPIVSLHALDPVYVDFTLPEQRIASLSRNLTVRVTTDAIPDRVFNGTLTAVDPNIDPATRNVRAQATFPNADALLRPGMFARVEILLPAKRVHRHFHPPPRPRLVVNLVIVIAGLQAIATLNVRQYPRSDNAAVTSPPSMSAPTPSSCAASSPRRSSGHRRGGRHRLHRIPERAGVSHHHRAPQAQLRPHQGALPRSAPRSIRCAATCRPRPRCRSSTSSRPTASSPRPISASPPTSSSRTDHRLPGARGAAAALRGEGVQRADILGARTFAMRIWLKPDAWRRSTSARRRCARRSPPTTTSPPSARPRAPSSRSTSRPTPTCALVSRSSSNWSCARKTGRRRAAGGHRRCGARRGGLRRGGALLRPEAVFMGIWVLPNANSLDVIKRVRRKWRPSKAELPSGLRPRHRYDATGPTSTTPSTRCSRRWAKRCSSWSSSSSFSSARSARSDPRWSPSRSRSSARSS
jgi:membrane fusion protein (multidrug efflux system)